MATHERTNDMQVQLQQQMQLQSHLQSHLQSQNQNQNQTATATATKERRILIDSRDRNRSVHPFPSEYEVRLDDDIDDVVAIRLVNASVPFSGYPINEPSRLLRVLVEVTTNNTTNVVPLSVALRPGAYDDIDDLVDMLKASFEAAVSGSGVAFDVIADNPRSSLVVRCTHMFSVLFETPAEARLASVLGFAHGARYPAVQVGAAEFIVTAPFRCNLDGDPYVVMALSPTAEVLISANNSSNRAFAVIHRDSSVLSSGTYEKYEKRWSTPIAKVAKVGVRFTDYFGQLYDFQNQDHHFELVVTSIERRKYLM